MPPFGQKPKPPTNEPSYRQIKAIESIDLAFNKLSHILLGISNNHNDMQCIVGELAKSKAAAKSWVLQN